MLDEDGEPRLDQPLDTAIEPDSRSQGATRFAPRDVRTKFPIDNDQIMLEGEGGELRLDWPLDTAIEPESRLFLSIPTGAHHIARAELRLELAGGQQLVRRLEPNRPLRLGAPASRARQISLRLVMNGPYRLSLGEAALFTPAALDFRQAYRLPQIQSVALDPTPRPQSDGLLVAKPGQVAGLLTPGAAPLRWHTPLDPALDLFRGIHLDYSLPQSDDTATCPLEIRIIGARASRSFRVCPPDENGYLYLPLARLSDGPPLDLGPVGALEWTLRLPVTSDLVNTDPAPFALQFTIDGITQRSAEQQVADTAPFKLGGKPVFPTPETSPGDNTTLLRQWRPLSTDVFREFLDNRGSITDSDHPWFFVERIVAEPKTPLLLETWLALNQPPESPPAPPRWPRIVTILGLLALIGLGWRFGWWRTGWNRCVLMLARTRSALGATGLRLGSRLAAGYRSVADWRHPVILFLSLVGLWQAGRWGFDPRSLLLVIAAALAGMMAWQRWRQPQNSIPNHFASLLGAAALGTLPWWFGYQGSSADAVWGVAPLASILYWQEPRLVEALEWLRQHRNLTGNALRLILWGALTAFLYRRGLSNPPASGENYAFTFGGMAAVLALRALLLTLEPPMRRRTPGVAERIYGGAGSLYFSAALLVLTCTALSLALEREALAEQLAIIVYYCLVVGTFKELIDLRRRGATVEGERTTASEH